MAKGLNLKQIKDFQKSVPDSLFVSKLDSDFLANYFAE